MNSSLRQKLQQLGAALLAGGLITFGGYAIQQPGKSALVDPDIQIAMVIGSYYESSGKHIGSPYQDKIGRGQPWTVCNGVTGPEVDPGKYYTEKDCYRLELAKYQVKKKEARSLLVHYDTYNVYQQASFLDMVWNYGATRLRGTATIRLANEGKLSQACERMTQWIYGTSNGELVPLDGLLKRRRTTRELCIDWSKTGGFQ